MKLRSILRVLSLLAFLSACVAGYLYYSSLKEYAFQEAERNALNRLQTTKKNLSAFFSENIKPVRVLAAMQPLVDVLENPEPKTLNAANAILDLFTKTLDVEVCYLMDLRGNTLASSNRNDPDSFVGMNFSFRPYFQDAMQGLPASYLALGTTSRKRGAYYSYPVYRKNSDTPLGIAVIKASIFFVEKELTPEETSIQLVVDPQGMIFISSRSEWLYQLMWQLKPDDIKQLRKTRQFGNGPWHWTGLRKNGNKEVLDASGKPYLFHQIAVDDYPGWKIVHLYDLKAASKLVSEPLLKIIQPVIIILCLLLGASIFFLYRQASLEIARRRTVEQALRQSEKRYRALYHHTPAMLHSIDKNGNLVSVSNYWSDALGYTREEVIGRKLTDYLSPVSRKYAEETIIPAFFKNGFIKDVPYQFIKKTRRLSRFNFPPSPIVMSSDRPLDPLPSPLMSPSETKPNGRFRKPRRRSVAILRTSRVKCANARVKFREFSSTHRLWSISRMQTENIPWSTQNSKNCSASALPMFGGKPTRTFSPLISPINSLKMTTASFAKNSQSRCKKTSRSTMMHIPI